MVVVKELVKDFGARRAVDGVSFEVEKGTVLGFLGPNGAGKSTTMRMITGFLPPTSGTAVIEGHDILQHPVAARRCLGYLPENAPSYGPMTVEEFLGFIAEVRGFSGPEARKRVEAALEKCFLQHVRNQTVETLSKGYRQRTCLAQALLHDPAVLLMDEPTDGLDPNQKQIVRDMIQEMSRNKVIILSTHVLEEVEAMCDRVVIISGGKKVSDSTPADLKAQSRYRNAVSFTVAADSRAAHDAFKAIDTVEEVLVTSQGDGKTGVELVPVNQQSIAKDVLKAADDKGWHLDDFISSPGRLDDVFRELTSTEDVAQSVKGGK